jgi:hypothetical protein
VLSLSRRVKKGWGRPQSAKRRRFVELRERGGAFSPRLVRWEFPDYGEITGRNAQGRVLGMCQTTLTCPGDPEGLLRPSRRRRSGFQPQPGAGVERGGERPG